MTPIMHIVRNGIISSRFTWVYKQNLSLNTQAVNNAISGDSSAVLRVESEATARSRSRMAASLFRKGSESNALPRNVSCIRSYIGPASSKEGGACSAHFRRPHTAGGTTSRIALRSANFFCVSANLLRTRKAAAEVGTRAFTRGRWCAGALGTNITRIAGAVARPPATAGLRTRGD